MTLIIFAVFGLAVGYLLGLTRRGFVLMAVVFIGAFVVELVHLLLNTHREALTLLPLVLGVVTVLCMLLGAWVRHRREDNSSAA
jgi:hypothetical protein